MRHLYFVMVCLFIGHGNNLTSQSIEVGIEYGVSSYFGDLSPFNVRASLTGGGPARGFYLGMSLHKAINIQLSHSKFTLQADDKNAEFELRKQRNLHFRSDLSEYGMSLEIKPFSFGKHGTSNKLQSFFILGINYFRFNPEAKYQGRWIELQPLGTEGQGIPGYSDPYSLNQISIPLGVGFKYYLDNNIVIGAGVKARMTFTDYLDDVSTTYADYNKLLEYNGQLAADLAFRSNELNNTELTYPTKVGRGNPSENDWYMSSYFTIGYVFSANSIDSYKKRRNIRCPGM